VTADNINEQAPEAEQASIDMLAEGSPEQEQEDNSSEPLEFEKPLDESESAPEAEAEFADVEDQFPADVEVDEDEQEESDEAHPRIPLDEQSPAVQAAERERALAQQAEALAAQAE